MKITCDERPTVLITVNGPGELFYWVMPLLNTLSQEKIAVQVWIFLTPCQFSSGREQKVLQENQLVTRIFSPSETKMICWGKSSLLFPRRGLVLFLGGDFLFAILLKKRSKYPLWVYGSHLRWSKQVDLYLARYRHDYERYQFSSKKFIGDLLYSYVKHWKPHDDDQSRSFFPGNPHILFLPGSRMVVYQYLLGLYQKIAKSFLHFLPSSTFAVGFPEYYSQAEISLPVKGDIPFQYYFGETSGLISQADLTISIPGSNNMELFYRKKKALILLPLETDYQHIPLTGIPELIGRIPGIGPAIKRQVIQSINQKKKWVSLPNILMDREIYPELRGKINLDHVVLKGRELINSGPFDIEIPESEFPSSATMVLTQLIQEKI